MQAVTQIGNLSQRWARARRALLAVVLLLLMVQLLGAAFHQHDYASKPLACASCALLQHLPPGLPPAAGALAPSLALARYPVAAPRSCHLPPRPGHLIPRAQAPPSLPAWFQS